MSSINAPDMSHYPPELLAKYLEENAPEEPEAEESDSSDWSTDREEDEDAMEGIIRQIKTLDITVPTDIASDDSGFSSEDEFTDKAVILDLAIRRSLILGRPDAVLKDWKATKIVDYYLGYAKQLNDADTELEELLSGGGSASGAPPPSKTRSSDKDNLASLTSRTKAEIQALEREDLIMDLVLLAQGLFKKEKKIKKFTEAQGMPIIKEH
jgi:hypothetical protein